MHKLALKKGMHREEASRAEQSRAAPTSKRLDHTTQQTTKNFKPQSCITPSPPAHAVDPPVPPGHLHERLMAHIHNTHPARRVVGQGLESAATSVCSQPRQHRWIVSCADEDSVEAHFQALSPCTL